MRFLYFVLFLFLSHVLIGQQAAQYSTYMLNPYAYNPAAAGLGQTFQAAATYRRQWNDLPGAPETVQVNGHFPLGIIPFGAGIQVETDALGAHRVNKAALAMNYQRAVGSNARISFGASVGYLQYRLDGSLLRAPQGQYEQNVFLHNDDFLPEGSTQAATPFVDLGFVFELNALQVGLAVLPVFAPALQFSAQNGIDYALSQHFIGHASYSFEVGEAHEFRPSVLVKSDGIQTQAEVSGIFSFNSNILLGASFRGVASSSRDAVVALVGGRINPKTTLVYAFDIPLSALKAGHRGSHELLLKYDLGRTLGKGNPPPLVYNPRFY